MLIIALLIAPLLLVGQEIPFVTGELAKALKMAEKEGKYVMVDGYTEWCGWCKKMDKEVFTDKGVAEFYRKHFISLKLNMEKEGAALNKELGITGYPTFVFYSPKGRIVHIAAGAREAKEFIMLGEEVMQMPEEKWFSTLREQSRNGKGSPEVLYDYTLALWEYGNPLYAKIFDQYRKKTSEAGYFERKNWDLFVKVVDDYESPVYEFISENREQYYEVAGKDAVNKFLLSVEFWYHDGQENWDKMVQLGRILIDEYDYFDANGLNNLAWMIYENLDDPEALQSATEWARQSVQEDRNYYNTDTYAHLLYKLGKLKAAKEWANISLELAKKEGIKAEVTEALLQKIAAAE